ncbi:MAG: 1,4-alpha-glucan branching protein GlgB [Eubacteriales bacterium]|nr:1,4-alpha-glucan branching protein GlgB [Eubacteriales bacterium]
MNSFTEYDSFLFHEGTNYEVYRKLGAHLCTENGLQGVRFAVWAPNAKTVHVLTEKTGWNEEDGEMELSEGGIWEIFIPGASEGDCYRFAVTGADGKKRYKSDPYAFYSELRPNNASRIFHLDGYEWHDGDFIQKRDLSKVPSQPMAIYEVHLGSWKKDYSRGEFGFLNYRELGEQLAEYLDYMGYTHVELIGISEHPFDGSWGYQVTGYYAPTSRYGTPEDFRYFVDVLHQHHIGVILDWVPAHFPKDEFGLSEFDGTALYESEDPLRAEYPEWGTKAFDHGKPEVRNFLIANAVYWVKEFHIDALRVDAVASMMYVNFGRSQWRPNKNGGLENLESIEFLKKLNSIVKKETGAFLIAEDSSIMEGITKDEKDGGIGFLFKWNMGWMNDTLKYIGKDPVFRTYHHEALTHTVDYAFLENWVLVLSHDEVVHLKHSMLEKFPGGIEDKTGGLKTLYTFQYALPGKKLLFMGQEFAEDREWDENRSINWDFAADFGHRDVMQCVKNLNSVYRTYSCLFSDSKDGRTFEWINKYDSDRNIVSFIRRNPWNYDSALLVICSFSPVEHHDYTCGVPVSGMYKRVFSTYDSLPGGGNTYEVSGGIPPIISTEHPCDGHQNMIMYSLRPYESIIMEFPVISEKDKKKSAAAETGTKKRSAGKTRTTKNKAGKVKTKNA